MTLNDVLKILQEEYLIIKAPAKYKEYKNYYLFFMHSETDFNGAFMFDKKNQKVIPYDPRKLMPGEAERPLREGSLRKENA